MLGMLDDCTGFTRHHGLCGDSLALRLLANANCADTYSIVSAAGLTAVILGF